MGLFSMIKRNAKLALKGAHGRAILIILIVVGVSLMLSVLRQAATTVFVAAKESHMPYIESIGDALYEFNRLFAFSPIEIVIAAVFTILNIFLLIPLLYGTVRWFFNLVHGRKLPLAEIFYFYESGKSYGKAILYYIGLYVRILLWTIPCFIVPSVILCVSVYFLSADGDISRTTTAISSAGIFLSVILYVLAGIFYAACINRYALGAYLLGENEGITAGQAIRQSISYTKGFRFSLVWFELSFFGWFLLSVIAFPVMFYVVPYYHTSFAMYARYIIEKNRFAQPNATREFNPADEGGADGQAREYPEAAPTYEESEDLRAETSEE